jgi:hypothetical protein
MTERRCVRCGAPSVWLRSVWITGLLADWFCGVCGHRWRVVYVPGGAEKGVPDDGERVRRSLF